MGRVIFFTFIFFSIINLSGCNPKDDVKSKEDLIVKTEGVYTEPTVKILGGNSLGEFLVDSEKDIIEIKIKNNSKFEIFDMSFTFDDSSGFSFRKDSFDDAVPYPGYLGNCGSALLSLSECTLYMEYNPISTGDSKISLIFNYKNLIGPASVSTPLSATTGLAASLIFVGEITSYKNGIVEQTVPTPIHTNLILKNAGGLSALDMKVNLINSNTPEGYSITQNNCPQDLAPKATCNIRVTFTSKNTQESDLPVDYLSNLRIQYTNDPFGTLAFLNAYWTTTSTQIKGEFTSGLPLVSFPEIIVGNKITKDIKITNNGHREAILLKIIFKNSTYGLGPDGLWATCSAPSNPGDFLECVDYTGAPIGVSDQYPFMLKDLNNCLNNEVLGIIGSATQGSSCFFEMTFHPSTTLLYSASHDFSGTTMEFQYDSRWKDNVTIIQSELYTANASALGAARFEVSALEFDNAFQTEVSNGNLDSLGESKWFLYDMGRRALISDYSYYTPLRIRILNIGRSRGTITDVTSLDALTAGTLKGILGSGASNITDYYRNALTTCFTAPLNPGETCQISINFSPRAFGNNSLEDERMYDYNSNVSDRYKRFNFTYADGSTINDDGSARANLTTQARFTATLVTKGYLSYDISRPPNDGRLASAGIVANEALTHEVRITNIGTGTIPYMKFRQFDPNNPIDDYELIPNPSFNNYPFTVIATAPGSLNSSTSDCLNKIDRRQVLGSDFVIDTYTFHQSGTSLSPNSSYITPDPSWALDQGTSCILTIQSKMPEPSSLTFNLFQYSGVEPTINSSIPERGREWSVSENNTLALRHYQNFNNNSVPDYFSIEYFDGDWVGRLADPTLHLYEYGNLFTIAPGDITKDDRYLISVSYRSPSSLAPTDPLPYSSGILYRPPINLPQVGIAADSWYLPSETVPEYWEFGNHFFTGTTSDPYLRSFQSRATAKNAYDPSYEHIYHMGTFPISNTYPTRINLRNFGDTTATSLNINWESVNNLHPIQFEASNGLPAVNSDLTPNVARAIPFSFNPVSPGEFSRILVYSYYTGVITKTKRVKVVGVAISGDFPDLTLEEETWDVTYDPDTAPAIESLSGVRNPISWNYNRVLDPSVADFSLEAVKRTLSSAPITLYARKRIHITNSSATQSIRDISIFFKEDSGDTAPYGTLASIGILNTHPTKLSEAGIEITNNACFDNSIDLGPGDVCYLDITFSPFMSGQQRADLVISYEIAPGQYIEKYMRMQLNSLDPASLDAQGLNTDPVLDSNAIVQMAYPLNYGNLTLTDYPRTQAPQRIVTISNNSTLAASFLKQWQCYQEEQLVINQKANTSPLPHVGEPNIWRSSSCLTDPDKDLIDDFISPVTSEDVGLGDPILIYDKLGSTVMASRSCFYGDSDYTFPDNSNYDKGFDSSSSNCTLTFDYSANEDYIMGPVNTAETLIQLYYYDFRRNSFSGNLYFYLDATIFPNPVLSGNFLNISSDQSGSLSFEWDPITLSALPSNPSWGTIGSYKIFGASSANQLSNDKIYTVPSLLASSYDVPYGVEAVNIIDQTITGMNINPGSYYYFKLAANRTINGKNYYVDSGMPILKVLVPPSNTYYDPDSNKLVDFAQGPARLSRSNSLLYCNVETYSLNDGGSIVSINKQLIDTPTHLFLKSNPAASSYVYQSSQHWLSDDAVDIESVFSLCQTYDPTKLADSCADFPSGENPPAYLIYSKTCDDSSCDMLYKAYGTINTYNEQFYTEDDNLLFYPRCFAPLP